VELRRYFYFTMWLVAYTFAIYFIGSFFAEGDAVWHQTVIRDTSFTPSHNVLFYACIPTYIFFGVGGFMYAITRLPAFSRGISVAHVLAVLGPVLILPNLGYNEWGHAYWLTEEIFSHPLHWGFVVLGWNALALPGVALQIIQRMIPLFHEVFDVKAQAA
jgi:methane/ammonia monooxygenase subunit C